MNGGTGRRRRIAGRTKKLGGAGLAVVAVLALFSCEPAEPPPQATIAVPPAGEPFLSGDVPNFDRRIFKESFTGDLDEMIGRRVIRILVTYSRTNFFLRAGEPRGFEYELLLQYRKHLRNRVKKRSWPVIFAFIPVRFDQLLPGLAAGWGDIAAAGLTITAERQDLVDFTEPYISKVDEIVVTAKTVEGLDSIEDLAGRRVYVNTKTSYAEHLRQLNARLAAAGRKRVKIIEADPHLATEDILELVDAGIIDITIADKHIVDFWSGVLSDIVPRPDLVLNDSGRIAWAVRKENPELRARLNEVIRSIRQGSLTGNVLINRYFKDTQWVANPLEDDELEKLDRLTSQFKRYGAEFGFDWLKLAAVAYQESRLDHSVESRAGAVGVMQVLPDTAVSPPILVADYRNIEGNIHAGTKYLAHMRDQYFNDPAIAPADRDDFTLASYNAGPSRIQRLRRLAEKQGLDPNRWMGNVEAVARRRIGPEPVRYVANINKYYIAYRLSRQRLEERARAIDAIRDRGAR